MGEKVSGKSAGRTADQHLGSDDESRVSVEVAGESAGPAAVDDPDPEAAKHQALPDLERLRAHAPASWTDDQLEELLVQMDQGVDIDMVVLASDIRNSSFLMKEAVDPWLFAATVSDLIEDARTMVHEAEGWFDKFTGDGFLAYWLFPADDGESDLENDMIDAASQALRVAETLIKTFEDRAVPSFRSNSRNFPSGVGLSIGLDAGPASLVKIAGELTVVGPPVVGAVRMVTSASAGETVANVYLGELLHRERHRCPSLRQVKRKFRSTKEYKGGQEVYPLRFRRPGDGV